MPEKVLAAWRSGLREVMLPAANAKDLREIPAAIRDHLRVRLVSTMEEVFDALLLPALATVGDEPEVGPRPRDSAVELADRPGSAGGG